MDDYTISRLAGAAGVSVHVVRDYVLRGLVHPARRTPGGYGLYDEQALARHNAGLLARVNASGRVFLTHTTLGGRYTIRMSIGQFRTERRHVEAAWELLRKAATER